jgi:hypothetical protein
MVQAQSCLKFGGPSSVSIVLQVDSAGSRHTTCSVTTLQKASDAATCSAKEKGGALWDRTGLTIDSS